MECGNDQKKHGQECGISIVGDDSILAQFDVLSHTGLILKLPVCY